MRHTTPTDDGAGAIDPRLLPRPEDELPHTPSGEAVLPWLDTSYFSLLDPTRGVHLAMHMTKVAGRSPGTRVAIGARGLGRESVVVRVEDDPHPGEVMGTSLGYIEAINLTWDGEHKVRWVGEAPEFSFDVLVTGVHYAPFFDVLFPGANPSGQKNEHSYSHTEQVIRGQGTLAWRDGPRTELEAVGWRDRGWGRRKNELSFGTGYDLIGGVLPDGGAFAFTAMRNVEHGPDAPLPVYGFLSDQQGVVPAIGGVYHKDTRSYPSWIDIEFANGARAVGEQVAQLSSLAVPFHDADPSGPGIGIHASDYYALLRDPEGREFSVFSNEGHTMRVDVTRDAKFFGVSQPAFT